MSDRDDLDVNNDVAVVSIVYMCVKVKFISGLIQLVTLSFNYVVVRGKNFCKYILLNEYFD